MKFAIYSRYTTEELRTLTSILERTGGEYEINPCCAAGFDVVVSYGGDGTFLSTARKSVGSGVPIWGINGGRVGFLATTSIEEVEQVVEALYKGDYGVEQRAMISVSGIYAEHGDALNEFTIQKQSPSMVHLRLEVDGMQVASYWADGVIVSTPTGSTAYSMSVGGAILVPQCECFVISPIAPHNLNLRPLVVSAKSEITITFETRYTDTALATIDNRQFEVPSHATFRLKKSERTLPIIIPTGHSFYQTLREKLHWGLDAREMKGK